MDTQLPMKIIFFVDSFFRYHLLAKKQTAFGLDCLHCVFNVFLGTRYAFISQLSMRGVSIVYSIFLLTHVWLCIPSFQSKLNFFVDSFFRWHLLANV